MSPPAPEGSITALLLQIRDSLFTVAGELALSESEIILQHVLQCTRSDLYLSREKSVGGEARARITALVDQRLSGKPLAYVLGKVHFYSVDLAVTPDVLIPRPDTESLVDVVLAHEGSDSLLYVDVGTGSGALCAVLSGQRPLWTGVAVDVSRAAIHVAQGNCSGRRVGFVCCDMLSALRPSAGRFFDFIVSNPPYVSEEEMPFLDDSVKAFEPLAALYGGKQGLFFYESLAAQGRKMLSSSGRLYCEIGATQAESVSQLLCTHGWNDIQVFPDLAQRPRVIRAVL